MKELREKIISSIEPIINKEGYTLYDLDWQIESSVWTLRVYADNKDKNINIDECATLSKAIGNFLDENTDLELENYNLEVSSPGLDRRLKSDDDFNWAMDKTLKVKYFYDGEKKKSVQGKLKSFNPEEIELMTKTNEQIIIKRSSIEKAKRAMIFEELVKKESKEEEEIEL